MNKKQIIIQFDKYKIRYRRIEIVNLYFSIFIGKENI